ncbi:hypothetical protein Syun_028512 [Stephania yunnanensis]|uniref:Pentatricopeptide repeat-containing protein n=1 Tax=Stephania yunnanensis TaxID=152371 RepID=A0AAP0HR68_9MAGN
MEQQRQQRAHICQCLTRIATFRRDKTLTIFGTRRKTGFEFVQSVHALALSLRQLGLAPGDVVAIAALNRFLRECVRKISSQHTNISHAFLLLHQFASIAQIFLDGSDLRKGRQVHAQVIVNGYDDTGVFGIRILGMYVLSKSLSDALNVFSRMELLCHASPWNWMIRGFTIMCCFEFALLFYFKMLGCGVHPDKYTFPYLIKACSGLSSVGLGRSIHEKVHSMGLDMDAFVGSALIKLYAENGFLVDARSLFDKIHFKDCVLWNVMLNGYIKNWESDEALGMFRKMRDTAVKPNFVTFACVLSACATEGIIEYGTQLHGLAVMYGLDSHSSVANTLLSVYSKCRCLHDARKLFDMMPQTDLVTWNGMIAGYVQNRHMDEAWDLFSELLSSNLKPDSITFSSFLPSVSELAGLNQCKEIHCYVIRHGVCLDRFLESALLDIYLKCGGIEVAEKIFSRTMTVDVVTCTTVISGYVLNGMHDNALEIFRWLIGVRIRPTVLTFASVLPAFTGLAALKLGKELHCCILKNGHEKKCHVGSALTDMYAKCGRLDIARQVFDRLLERDSVVWNAMITSYCQNGKPGDAIDLFRQMGLNQTEYDCVTISAVLSACANLPALRYGKEIHGFMVKGGLRSDLFAESALIDMYGKCGHLVSARRAFDLMKGKNEVSWNSMIAAYGTHGHINEALSLFHEMLENQILPDHVTFLAIISACSHVGLLDKGLHYFRFMTQECGIIARMEHYACMVDLLGRAGRLNDALSIIRGMPFDPDPGIWGALLGASRMHGDVEIAEIASHYVLKLDPQNSGYYTLLSNARADAGHWDGVAKIRSLMKERGVQKLPGCSWIEVNGTTNVFAAADVGHPQATEIYHLLKMLLLELRKEGYAPRPYLPPYCQTEVR